MMGSPSEALLRLDPARAALLAQDGPPQTRSSCGPSGGARTLRGPHLLSGSPALRSQHPFSPHPTKSSELSSEGEKAWIPLQVTADPPAQGRSPPTPRVYPRSSFSLTAQRKRVCS